MWPDQIRNFGFVDPLNWIIVGRRKRRTGSHKRGVDRIPFPIQDIRVYQSGVSNLWAAGLIGHITSGVTVVRNGSFRRPSEVNLPWRVAVSCTKRNDPREGEVMKKRRLGIVLLVVVAALVAAPATIAQETRGKITGRVTDTSKAVIPGATITVTDATRGTTANATSNELGLFQVSYLLPGTYTVAVELTGFRKHVQQRVIVETGVTVNLPVILEIGGVQEAVNVSAETPLMRTSDANLGLVVDQARLASLPLIHGDPYKIMGLASGVTFSGSVRLDRPFEPSHITNYAYNGTRGLRSDLLIDGVPSTATANANEVIATYVPPSDLVQEMKVQTATFDAQFGNTEGGVTSMSIKSGTNKLHGSAYYFAEPSSMGANDYWGKLRGQPKIESNSNRPGVTIGGPIRTDKTFFMFGYERITDKRPRFDIAGTSWVPTEALKNGDFSAYSSYVTIYDPASRVASGSNWVGTAFSGNVIPSNRIDPVAKAILAKYYPASPKNPGTDPTKGPAGNITDSTLAERTQAYNTITARIDQKISDKNKLFGRISWYERNSNYNDYLGTTASGTWFQFASRQAVIDDVHIFNSTTVLNVRYGYNRFDRNADMQKQEAHGFDLTQIGFPAQYNSFVTDDVRRFPRLDFPGGETVSVAYGNDFRPITSNTIAATLTKSMAAHSLKGGFELRQYGEVSRSTGNNQSGQYAFTNAYTRLTSASGSDYQGLQAYASFLLGLPNTTSWTRAATYDEYSRTYGFFVQDDWRVGARLTLNLGLRYEVESALVEKQNKSVSGFDFAYVQPIQTTAQANYATITDTTPNPITGQTLKAMVPTLNVKGGLLYAGKDTGSGLYNTPKDTFLPRFGAAFQLTPKTVIRGGVGLFAGFLGQRRGDVIQTGFSQTTTVSTTLNANGAPIPVNWDNAFLTTAILEPTGNTLGKQSSIGNSISFFNQDPRTSKQLRWQIGVERELPGGFTVNAAYVGNYGYDIEINRNLNALPIQYLSTDTSRTAAMTANNAWLSGSVPNPFAGLLPGTGMNSSTIARRSLLLPYPEFGSVTTTNNDGKSWYSAFQTGVQKRFSKGYTVGVSYTYSRWMQATEYLNAADPNPTKMISDLDSPHRLSLSGIYSFPFGKGRKFLSSASGLTEALVGGWQIQGVYAYQTGFPVSFGDLFYGGAAIGIANPTTSQWFNTSAFTSILTDPVSNNSVPVDHLRTLPMRFDDVRINAFNNFDVSLIKDVRIKGNVRMQLRLEYINVLDYAKFNISNVNVTATNTLFGSVTASNQDNYARRAQVGVKLLF
jgi:hypothetical protein